MNTSNLLKFTLKCTSSCSGIRWRYRCRRAHRRMHTSTSSSTGFFLNLLWLKFEQQRIASHLTGLAAAFLRPAMFLRKGLRLRAYPLTELLGTYEAIFLRNFLPLLPLHPSPSSLLSLSLLLGSKKAGHFPHFLKFILNQLLPRGDVR